MEGILDLLAIPLGFLMRLSYSILGNYGWAILLFTVLARIILLPIAIWLHRYSIRLVKMTPALLEVKTTYFGDNDRIAEAQAKLYKEYNYNPLITLVPLAIQIILLMGVIQVINHPLEYILKLDQDVIAAISELTIDHLGLAPESSSVQLSAINLIQSGTAAETFAGLTGAFSAELLTASLESIRAFNIRFFGINIMLVPSMEGGLTVLAPVVAGLAALCLCIVQNKANALQHEQGMANRITTALISVGLSAYLGYFVPMGVALYWVAGNFVAIVQQYFLNAIIPPQKHIDYEALEKNREKLHQLEATQVKVKRDPELVKREKEDYKRFASITNKHLVFYSEKSGFYKYYRHIVEYLLAHTDAVIHYVTNDPHDQVFELAKKNHQLKPYYIGPQKIIPFMMKMDADIVVMTTPDLDKYYLKRSYVRKDIEYVYAPHGITSSNLTTQIGAYDHFDTILCCAQYQINEFRESEEIYNLPKKNLVPCGYGLLDELIERVEELRKNARNDRKRILIAPSWQKDNILESCIEQLVDQLYCDEYELIIRPHPEFIKRYPDKMQHMQEVFEDRIGDNLVIETDFSSNESIFSSDLLITDWSAISFEFAFAAKRPVLSINTPMKVTNPDYVKYKNQPIDITMRNDIGGSLDLDQLSEAKCIVERLLENQEEMAEKIGAIRDQNIFNIGSSGKASAKYLMSRLMKKNRQNNVS